MTDIKMFPIGPDGIYHLNPPSSGDWKQEGNTSKQVGTLSQREQQAVHLRFLGKSSGEIASVIGITPMSVRRWFMKGGRLADIYDAYSKKQLAQNEDVIQKVLDRAKEEAPKAFERMVGLSETPDLGPTCYKANEFILNATAKVDASLKTHLQDLSFEIALERVNEVFRELYSKTLYERRELLSAKVSVDMGDEALLGGVRDKIRESHQ